MKAPKKSEKLFLKEIIEAASHLLQRQRGLGIGELIVLVRSQLGMSQRALAKRAHVTQSTISRLESGQTLPRVSTLQEILGALDCDLVITLKPRTDLHALRRRQASLKAQKKIDYVRGTMSLEQQLPDDQLMQELLEEETRKLEETAGPELWEESL